MSEPRPEYNAIGELSEDERRLILRYRQMKQQGVSGWLDGDAMTLRVVTRTEYLAPRVVTATAPFLPVDTIS